MSRFLEFLKLFPAVLGAVVSLEATPAANGASKKDVFLSTLDALAKAGEVIPVPQVQMVSTLIDAVVSALNKAGVFTTTPKA